VEAADKEEVWRRAAANRRLAADLFDGLTPAQWQTPSLCAGWTVREVAAHLLMPLEIGLSSMVLLLLRERGSFDRVADRASRELARRPVEEIVQVLREKADFPAAPPGVGVWGPFTDTCVHLRDAARPLGSDVSPPVDDWRLTLDFLISPTARRGFVPRGRLDGLTLEATDQDWIWGHGPTVAGASEALAMAAAGRAVVLAELTGEGVPLLGERLAVR
jgi:uncharacterized protein (TIGR03083 family)